MPARSRAVVGLSALLAVFALTAGGASTSARAAAAAGEAEPGRLSGAALVTALRRGGYVVYFRHAATDFSMEDSDTGNLDDCSKQRNLDARGRSDARAIGAAWRGLRLSPGAVVSSRYCRARDTARLAFGRYVQSLDVTGLPSATTGAERTRRIAALRRLLARRPARGNMVVAHLFNIQEAANLSLEEGEAAVFEPRGTRGFRLVATVAPRAWGRLAPPATPAFSVREYRVPGGSASARRGARRGRDASGTLPRRRASWAGSTRDRRRTRHIPLGDGSAPHGVIVGPDGAPWITDGGLNAIVRVDPRPSEVQPFPLPADRARREPQHRRRSTSAACSGSPARAASTAGSIRRAGRSRSSTRRAAAGPTASPRRPDGAVYYASLAGSHIARIDPETGQATVIEPPTAGQGARRVWSDSRGRVWVSEWNAGQVGVYDPADAAWREWRLPGADPQPYAVYVDDRDIVWLSDFGANALVRFDPRTARFQTFPLPSPGAAVRQILGRPARSGVRSRGSTSSSSSGSSAADDAAGPAFDRELGNGEPPRTRLGPPAADGRDRGRSLVREAAGRTCGRTPSCD